MTFVTVTCCNCGIEFGLRSEWNDRLMADGNKWFYCPSGHRQHYTETVSDRLRRERDRLKQQLAQKDDEIAAAKKEAERLAKRTKAGLCPCCNRSFTNLKRHMASKHPKGK